MLSEALAAVHPARHGSFAGETAQDFKVIRGLSTRIFRLTHPAADEMVQRRQPRSRQARSQRKGKR